MKLSLFSGTSYLVDTEGYAACTAFCQKLGIEAVEGYPSEKLCTEAHAKELRRALDDAGMTCCCFSAGADLSGEHPEKTMDDLKRYLEMAGILGAPYLHHTLVPKISAPLITDPTFSSLFAPVIERAAVICDAAAANGITCLYEDQGLYFNGRVRFQQFLDAMPSRNIGVCMDVGNIYFVDEDPRDFLSQFLPYVKHVHVKDYLWKPASAPNPGDEWLCTRNGNRLLDVICGHGVVPFVELFRQLRLGGYDGWYSLEYASQVPFAYGNTRSAENLRRYYELAATR